MGNATHYAQLEMELAVGNLGNYANKTKHPQMVLPPDYGAWGRQKQDWLDLVHFFSVGATTHMVAAHITLAADVTPPVAKTELAQIWGVPTEKSFYDIFYHMKNVFDTQATADPTYALASFIRYSDFIYTKDPTGGEKHKVSFSSFSINAVRLSNEQKFFDFVREANENIANSPLADNAYIMSSIVAFWEVFLELEKELLKLAMIDAGVIFLVTLLFFEGDFLTALITALSCTMITTLMYGLSAVAMNFNIFVATYVLLAMGISVEFTCHLAAAFSRGRGTTEEKIGQAMAHTFPPMFEGFMTTLLSALPFSWHTITFFSKYNFGLVALILLCGLLTGMVFMPAMLGLLDRIRGAGPRASLKVQPNQ
jgi:predicted RND superfamily exporter protein